MESEAFYFINQGLSPNFLFFYTKTKQNKKQILRVKIALNYIGYSRGQGNRQNQLLRMPWC